MLIRNPGGMYKDITVRLDEPNETLTTISSTSGIGDIEVKLCAEYLSLMPIRVPPPLDNFLSQRNTL